MSQPTLRELSRQAVRRRIETVAMELILDQGFDATTVDQIATAAGISPRSFFRYFPAKEDLVIGDPLEFGAVLRDTLQERPDDEGPVTATRRTLDRFVETVDANPAALGISTVVLVTPSLQAKHLEKQNAWLELMLPDVRRRLGDVPHADLRARAITLSALTTFHTTLMYWAGRDGTDDLHTLLDLAWESVEE